ncbi:HAD-IB family hydrolase [Clostridium grantii]|uniref:phosphoserine phosphatase n=1 Tax=Clostridium grantii DSM 8605 TaxID=1121316 RepID=A0A1M5RJZ1_9CLOT|nr:HAD-IB family hydrolase [Clostridium grantii]SHH26574.1 HAD-superfamily subfamily IB hydrolase, TIGR01490 [Clostridium grantii DSM 8605]
MKKVTAAFFDIDGTLYREGLITEIFKKLIKSEIIDSQRWYNEVKEHYVKWDKRIGNYDNYLLKMAEIYVDAIIGLHETQVNFIAKKVIEQKGDRVYTFTRDKIEWHKAQGHKVITVSGSPNELVREMSIKFGFDDFVGSEYLMDSNKMYTGEVIPMWDSDSKKNAINSFVKKYNIDLSESYAYGDTAGDFTMLSMVEYPTAINPTRELLTKISNHHILQKSINIIVERKDVVYNLNYNCIK